MASVGHIGRSRLSKPGWDRCLYRGVASGGVCCERGFSDSFHCFRYSGNAKRGIWYAELGKGQADRERFEKFRGASRCFELFRDSARCNRMRRIWGVDLDEIPKELEFMGGGGVNGIRDGEWGQRAGRLGYPQSRRSRHGEARSPRGKGRMNGNSCDGAQILVRNGFVDLQGVVEGPQGYAQLIADMRVCWVDFGETLARSVGRWRMSVKRALTLTLSRGERGQLRTVQFGRRWVGRQAAIDWKNLKG